MQLLSRSMCFLEGVFLSALDRVDMAERRCYSLLHVIAFFTGRKLKCVRRRAVLRIKRARSEKVVPLTCCTLFYTRTHSNADWNTFFLRVICSILSVRSHDRDLSVLFSMFDIVKYDAAIYICNCSQLLYGSTDDYVSVESAVELY